MLDALTCAQCDRPTQDGNVCSQCAEQLEHVLERLPGYMAELELVVSRQTTSGPGGARGVGHEYALPFADTAADFHWAVRNTVAEWARTVVQERYAEPDKPLYGPPCWWIGCDHPTCPPIRHWLRWQALKAMPVTFSGLCRWLAGQAEWLRHRPMAAQAYAELLSLEPAIKRWLDSRGWAYVGPCQAIVPVLHFTEPDNPATVGVDVIEQPCDTSLRLYDGAQVIRCPGCGAEYDAAAQDQVVLLALRSQYATAAEIARLLTNAGKRVSVDRLHKWASRRKLTPTLGPQDPHRSPPLYRIGQVLDLLDAAKAPPRNASAAPSSAPVLAR